MTNEIKEMLELHIKNGIDLLPKNQKKALDYITNLQEENERLYKELEKADSITQSCIFEGSRSAGKSYRQCLNWLEDYKSRIDKAVDFTNRTIEVIKQQPSGNDEWILERLNGINYCLGGDE